ncbi:ACP S-malonyltransferase [Rhodococcus sp. X156]|uniref:ACP S-malonyltransferase n=1 Tax=Rhodococcus sp. X156 TaxID=2499145 RepID=UPI000FD71FC0|nr:ACP S-malonyltransferase [Rhodococcus sp. X156]
MIALLAPGQGSQAPGMLEPWLALPGAPERVAAWSAAADLDLARLGTTATAEEITDTAVTQPLVVALALLAYEELERRGELPSEVLTAGHSVGELAAAAIAGVFSPDDAVALAAVRGAAMGAACAAEATGMAAVLGGDAAEVTARLDELGLVPANQNAKGQVVAAGLLTALDALEADPPAKARIRRLSVAGAFHTPYMASAQDAVAERVAAITPHDPVRPLLSNADGQVVHSGQDVLRRLVTQVTNPVRWDACMATMAELGATALVELPPSGALVGMAKRELRGTPTLALKTPDDLAALTALAVTQ